MIDAPADSRMEFGDPCRPKTRVQLDTLQLRELRTGRRGQFRVRVLGEPGVDFISR